MQALGNAGWENGPGAEAEVASPHFRSEPWDPHTQTCVVFTKLQSCATWPWTPSYPFLFSVFVTLQEIVTQWIAESRIALEEIRLLTLKAAHSIDTLDTTAARKEVRPLWPLPAKPSPVSLPTGRFRSRGALLALRILEASMWFWFKAYKCLPLASFPFTELLCEWFLGCQISSFLRYSNWD